jgi:hypothetical protein
MKEALRAKKPIPSGIAVDGASVSREHGYRLRGEIE